MKYYFVVMLAVMLMLNRAHAVPELASNGVAPINTNATEDEIKNAASVVRAGEKLTPKVWKEGARVAVCLSFDVDNEFHTATVDALPVALSTGEYGATTGLPRILAVLERQQVPASFYIPAGAAMLHPEMIGEILKSRRNEIGVHGWVHEYIPMLTSADHEWQLLTKSIDYLTRMMGKKPVGYRAPDWEFGPHTVEQLLKAGFKYDSSMMAMDQPYELLANGRRTGLTELPVSWALDDFAYFGLNSNGSSPDPEAVFRIFRSEFDVAYEEGTLVVLTLHPAVSGLRSRVIELDKLITYMKSRPGVWFATLEEAANYTRVSHEN